MSEEFLDLNAPAMVEGILAKSTKRHPQPSAWGPTSVVLISTNGCSLNTNHPLWWRDRPLNNILDPFLWPVRTARAALLGLRQCRGALSLTDLCWFLFERLAILLQKLSFNGNTFSNVSISLLMCVLLLFSHKPAIAAVTGKKWLFFSLGDSSLVLDLFHLISRHRARPPYWWLVQFWQKFVSKSCEESSPQRASGEAWYDLKAKKVGNGSKMFWKKKFEAQKAGSWFLGSVGP